jgi:hypothetical protein
MERRIGGERSLTVEPLSALFARASLLPTFGGERVLFAWRQRPDEAGAAQADGGPNRVGPSRGSSASDAQGRSLVKQYDTRRLCS